MSRPDRATRKQLRYHLGRHDRWGNPLLAGIPRRKRWTAAEAHALLAALFDQFLRERFFAPNLVEELIYRENPLLSMLERQP